MVSTGFELTTMVPVAPLAASVESPAKLASTAPEYVPAATPARLTPLKVATPALSVIAVPTVLTVPPSLSEKITVLPGSGEPLLVRVAVNVALLPESPLPETAERLVAMDMQYS